MYFYSSTALSQFKEKPIVPNWIKGFFSQQTSINLFITFVNSFILNVCLNSWRVSPYWGGGFLEPCAFGWIIVFVFFLMFLHSESSHFSWCLFLVFALERVGRIVVRLNERCRWCPPQLHLFLLYFVDMYGPGKNLNGFGLNGCSTPSDVQVVCFHPVSNKFLTYEVHWLWDMFCLRVFFLGLSWSGYGVKKVFAAWLWMLWKRSGPSLWLDNQLCCGQEKSCRCNIQRSPL